MNASYHETRLTEDPRRATLWRALWRYHFSRSIGPEDCVLDLGCGYGDFINAVCARRRIALDVWPGFPAHLSPGVEPIVGPVTDLSKIEPESVDFAFASNLFEHLTQNELVQLLDGLRARLTSRGTLNILQPNYRYAYREYFDDYTHITVYSHVSLVDFLTGNGFDVFDLQPRFLPLTLKSRLPVSPLLIGAYLASPIKPMGKQMFLRARCR
jgi:SAM-dependent methyltransferase